MIDERIIKQADVMVNYSLKIKKNEKVIIRGEAVAYPLIQECYKAILKVGAFPYVEITNPKLDEILYEFGSTKQITHFFDNEIATVKHFDVALTIKGTEDTRIFEDIDPKKIKMRTQGRAEIATIHAEKISDTTLRWAGTQFPAIGEANEAGMELSAYEDFVYDACKVNTKDPIKEWKSIEAKQEIICDFLNSKQRIRFVAKDTDISFNVSGRKWVNCCGKVNLPDGEIFTGPIEDSVNGYIKFSFPGIYAGKEIEDIRLEFKDGKVISATASKGEKLLNEILETDEGSKFVGEVAIGTNYNIKHFTKNMLCDEKIGGTVHIALGRSLPRSLGKNKSLIHWDMLCDMKENGKIYADEEVIYENGNFII